jgi:hypothetical protein
MRPGLAGICGVRRLGRSCWCDAPALLADSIKAAARFIANMLRKIFPLGISVWALH